MRSHLTGLSLKVTQVSYNSVVQQSYNQCQIKRHVLFKMSPVVQMVLDALYDLQVLFVSLVGCSLG